MAKQKFSQPNREPDLSQILDKLLGMRLKERELERLCQSQQSCFCPISGKQSLGKADWLE